MPGTLIANSVWRKNVDCGHYHLRRHTSPAAAVFRCHHTTIFNFALSAVHNLPRRKQQSPGDVSCLGDCLCLAAQQIDMAPCAMMNLGSVNGFLSVPIAAYVLAARAAE